MKKAAAAKKARLLAKNEMFSVVGNDVIYPVVGDSYKIDRLQYEWQRATVDVTFYHATNRRRDADNAMASLKPYYDGIVDSGLLPDDSPQHMVRPEPKFKLDKEHPRVELLITRLA